MPFDYQISEGLVMLRLTGSITHEDLLGMMAALQADPAFEPEMPRLADLRGLTEVRLTPGHIHEVKAAAGPLSRGGRTAIVIRHDLGEIVAHFFRLSIKTWEIRVFKSMDEAQAWVRGR